MNTRKNVKERFVEWINHQRYRCSERGFRDTLDDLVSQQRVSIEDAPRLLQQALANRYLIHHLSIHMGIGMSTPPGIGAPISMTCRPLWTLANRLGDYLRGKPESIHNLEVMLLSAIPTVGNFAYLANIVENPELFGFFTYHISKNLQNKKVKGVVDYIANQREKILKGLSAIHANYEAPLALASAYGFASENTPLAIFAMAATAAILYKEYKEGKPSALPRAMRILPVVGALLIARNKEVVDLSIRTVESLSTLALVYIGYTLKAIVLEYKYRLGDQKG